jgi:hypothetical protein
MIWLKKISIGVKQHSHYINYHMEADRNFIWKLTEMVYLSETDTNKNIICMSESEF